MALLEQALSDFRYTFCCMSQCDCLHFVVLWLPKHVCRTFKNLSRSAVSMAFKLQLYSVFFFNFVFKSVMQFYLDIILLLLNQLVISFQLNNEQTQMIIGAFKNPAVTREEGLYYDDSQYKCVRSDKNSIYSKCVSTYKQTLQLQLTSIQKGIVCRQLIICNSLHTI